MKVELTTLRGIEDAITSLYQSKGNYTSDKGKFIRAHVFESTNDNGFIVKPTNFFNEELAKVFKYGVHHTTILRYIDFSFVIEGLHRGGQDDLDSHAERFHTRIVRQSTRLGTFKDGAVSDYYKGKILTTDQVLKTLGVEIPDSVEIDGKTYVKGVNGYILEEHKSEQDVVRGLYNLAIPCSCICKIDLFQFSHVYKMRNKNTKAHEELRDVITSLVTQLAKAFNMEESHFIEILETIVN